MADENFGYRIEDIELSQRPRERLEKYGAEVLTNAELLAILIRVGKKGSNAIQVGQKLLGKFNGLKGLQQAKIPQLCEVDGVGQAKAVQIKAAIEVGHRIARHQSEEKIIISGPQDVADQVQYTMSGLEQEQLWVLLLDSRNRLMKIEDLYHGSLNSSSVRPAEIFKAGIRMNAASLIIVHNHPSGDPTPSPEDIQLTRMLIEAGAMLELEILDHVVIGSQGHCSIKSLHPEMWK